MIADESLVLKGRKLIIKHYLMDTGCTGPKYSTYMYVKVHIHVS